MSKEVQVNLRLPADLKDQIHESAKQNNRSLNAELNERLISSFSTSADTYSLALKTLHNLFSQHSESPRLLDIKNRLNFLLKDRNNISYSKNVTPALIAYELNYDYANDIQQWFSGNLEPSFDELKAIAHFFGCNESWLLFGIGIPFPSKSMKLSDVSSTLKFCVDPEEFNKVIQISFIRKKSDAGELLVIKHFDDTRCRVYSTGVHVSDIVGATGERMRAILTLALEAFDKSLWKTKVNGYLFEEDLYANVVSGRLNPLSILNKYTPVPWIDDLWDDSMYSKENNSYWEGWTGLCYMISSYIDNNPKLLEEQTLIKSKEHGAIKFIDKKYDEFFAY